MKRFLTFLSAFVLLLWGLSSVADAQTVSFTGTVKDSSGQSVGGATITQTGNPSVTTTSDTSASNNFTLTGLTPNTPFSFKISKQGYIDVYSGNISLESNYTLPVAFTLFTANETAQWNITPGKAVITGRAINESSPQTNIDGVVVSAASGLHPGAPYTVVYPQNSGPPGTTSTATNGKFMIPNVDDGDTVTVTATKAGWTFHQKVFTIHADAVSQGLAMGTQGSPPQTISFTGSVKNPGSPNPIAVSGASVEMVGNASVNATSAADGTFTVAGLPSGTDFSLKVSAAGFVSVYTSVFNSTSNIVSSREYMLQTTQQISGWGITQGKSAITGRVVDNSNPQTGYIGGAVVTFTSTLYPSNPPYTVGYQDASGPIGGTATYPATGKFFILNVEDGDTISVTVTKQGWTFPAKTFVTHADGISQGAAFGTAAADPNLFSLSAGWNFVSFPKQPVDTAIGAVLSDILSDVKVVWAFDNDQKVWKRYKPGAGDNMLATIDQGKGYWIYLSADHTLDLTTWTAGSTQVHLYAGWNLVGYAGTNGTSVIPSLTNVSGWQVIWSWVGSTWKAMSAVPGDLPIPPLSSLAQGRAYWVKMADGVTADWTQ